MVHGKKTYSKCKMDQHIFMKYSIDVVFYSTLQLTFKKLLLEFWCSIKEQTQLYEKAVKIFLPFPTTYPCEARFPSYTSARKIFQHRLNTEADMRNQLSPSSVRNERDLQKILKTPPLSKLLSGLDKKVIFY